MHALARLSLWVVIWGLWWVIGAGDARAQSCSPAEQDDRGRCPPRRRLPSPAPPARDSAAPRVELVPTAGPRAVQRGGGGARLGTCRRPIPLRLGAASAVTGDTSRSRHATAGTCVSNGTAPELVYSFRLTEAQAVLFHLESEFDGALYLRNGCAESAEELSCNDDDGDTRHSYLGRFLQPGTYFLFVDGFDVNAGRFTLTSRVEADCVRGDAVACDNMGYIFLRGEGTGVDCPAAVRAFSIACDAHHARACNRLGLMYESGTCLPVAGAQAARYYTLGCDGGFGIACSNNGRLYEEGRGGVAADLNAARRWFARGCQADDFSGCGTASRIARRSQAFGEAVELAQRGCDGSDGASCNELALLYDDGHGVVRNQNRAAQLYEQACNLNHATACSNLGQMLLGGEGTEQDRERARGLFERACSEEPDGNRVGCHHLGRLYRDGVTVTADRVRARRLFELGCERDFFEACNELGVLCGSTAVGDYDCARSNYQRACDGGYLQGCSNLAILHANALGVERDLARAAELFQRACAGGVLLACDRLAAQVERGAGVARDPDRAVTLYRTACDGNRFESCANLGRVLANDPSLVRDDARAAALFQRACENNVASGCYWLGVFHRDGRGGAVRSRERATTLFERACAAREEAACTALRAPPSPGVAAPAPAAR